MKIAVCDDEKVFRDVIVEYLKPYKEKIPDIIESEFCCGEDLIAEYESGGRFDLIFLDVKMQNVSGVEAGRKIRLLDNDVMFIFITGFTQYVSDAFSLNAMQFLEKPLVKEKFNKEMDRALCIYKKKKFKYKITFNDTTDFIELKDIIYIETYGRHLRAVTSTGIFEYTGNISAEEKKLFEYGFLRCHKGYLINMQYIYKPDKDRFILQNKNAILISRNYKNEAISRFNRYISSYCV